jgi:hypothetical protein
MPIGGKRRKKKECEMKLFQEEKKKERKKNVKMGLVVSCRLSGLCRLSQGL